MAELQSRGFEAAHWSEIGAASASDREVLGWCADRAHVLFTHDLDFGSILAGTKGRAPSVVQLRIENVTPEAMGQRVASTLRQLEETLAAGALVTIEPNRHRARLLPLDRS